jgi:DNA-binding NarL/FixJ family response regulator
MSSNKILNDLRVLIVAEDPLARAGLATLLADQLGCEIVGQEAGTEALARTETDIADVVVMDMGWDPSRTLETEDDLRELGRPVVALVPDASSASEVWASGVAGLLLRDEDGAGLMAAISAVFNGMIVVDPELAGAIMPAASHATSPPAQPLTPRELGVLQLLAEGLPNKAIAHRLDISEHTVKFHVNSILSKLDAQSRTEAVVHATRQGLILL